MTNTPMSPKNDGKEGELHVVTPGTGGLTLGLAVLWMLGITAVWMGVLIAFNFLIVRLVGL